MKRTQRYTIDGRTYASLEEMPPEVRKKWDTVSALVNAMTGLAGQTTTIKFEQTIQAGDFDPAAGLSRREAVTWDAGPGQTGLVPDGAPSNSVTRTTKLLSASVLVLLFAVFALAMLATLSTVRLTIRYGPEWVACCVLVALALVRGLVWGWERSGRNKMTFGTGAACLVAMSLLAFLGILGGIPILAHHMTAGPGELIVTVRAKEAQYDRGHCTPRLKINEFTFALRDYLCPGNRAFDEIDVGAKIRLQGSVSQFGIEPGRMYWTKSR